MPQASNSIFLAQGPKIKSFKQKAIVGTLHLEASVDRVCARASAMGSHRGLWVGEQHALGSLLQGHSDYCLQIDSRGLQEGWGETSISLLPCWKGFQVPAEFLSPREWGWPGVGGTKPYSTGYPAPPLQVQPNMGTFKGSNWELWTLFIILKSQQKLYTQLLIRLPGLTKTLTHSLNTQQIHSQCLLLKSIFRF